jgi:hypothetical protein
MAFQAGNTKSRLIENGMELKRRVLNFYK